ALCRHAMVRDFGTEYPGSKEICRGHPRAIPRQTAGIQLLTFVQLESQVEPVGDRSVPTGTGGHGLPLPVRDAGGFSCVESLHLRTGARLCAQRYVGLFAAAAARICLV